MKGCLGACAAKEIQIYIVLYVIDTPNNPLALAAHCHGIKLKMTQREKTEE